MKIPIFFFSLATVFVVLFSSLDGHCSILKSLEDKLALSFYSPNVPTRFIVVEKSKQQLMVFELQHSLKLLKKFVCATGENPGNKIVRGDLKTPEGVYFITETYKDKKITIFGNRAYHLDYPNVFDKHAGRLGDGIFIHGTNKSLAPYSTNGCITLTNKDLDELAAYLTINAVPVIVLEHLPAPLFGTDLKINKNDSRFNEILHELSVTPEYLSSDNVETLSFLTFGSQAIASIAYRAYDGGSVEYRYRKRVYLAPSVSKKWRTIYSIESQDTVPSILALHPVKNILPEQTNLPENVTVPMDIGEELPAFVKEREVTWVNGD